MDVLDGLPLELVGLVLDHLTSEELVDCLQVSSAWRRVVGSFRGVWARRCTDYGVPDHCLSGNEDPVAVFLAARRQRNYLRTCKYRVYEDVRGGGGGAKNPTDDGSPRQVVYAGNGIVVAVVFRPRQKEQQQQTAAPEREAGAATGLSGVVAFTPYNELKQRYQFGYLLVERLSETGVGAAEVCRVQLEDKWKWPVVTKAFAANDGSWVIIRVKETWIENAWYKIVLPTSNFAMELSDPTWRAPDFSSEHHPSVPYDPSCCSSCSAVALVRNKLSMRPLWEFGVDILHLSRDQQLKEHTVPIFNYDQMRLSSDVHANVTFRAFFFSQEPRDADSCRSHKLVLWRTNDHTITVHSCTDEEGVSRQPDATFSPLPQGKTLELSTAWGHTKLKISADFRLLGFLVARHLHMWSLKTNKKLSTIYLEGIPGLRSWMLALGHVYSLFGTLHGGGEMVLVVTKTGEVVWRGQSFLKEEEGSTVTPMQHSGVVHEDWMSNVNRMCPINHTPFLLFSPMNTTTHLSGLAFSI